MTTREGCSSPLADLAELMVIGRSEDSPARVFYHHHVSSRLAPIIICRDSETRVNLQFLKLLGGFLFLSYSIRHSNPGNL